MELIKTLDSRSWITSTGNKTSDRFGLFKCKYCNNEVELRLSKGKNQKSCGSKECSMKAHSDGYNRELSANNIGNTKDNRTSKPYYSSIKSIYSLHKKNLIPNFCNNFSEFYEIIYDEYVSSKNKFNGKKISLVINDDKLFFDIRGNIYNDRTFHEKNIELLNNSDFNSYMLSIELETTQNHLTQAIKKAIKNNHPDFNNYDFENNRVKLSRGLVISILNEEQYNYIFNTIKYGSRNKSSSIYIIKSSYGSYKIGISGNVKNRLSTINSQSCPSISYELIHSKYIGKKALQLEQAIHKKLKEKEMHIQFEWFSIDKNTLKTVVSTIDNNDIFLNKINVENRNKAKIESENKNKIFKEKIQTKELVFIDIKKKKEEIKLVKEEVRIKNELIKNDTYITTRKTQPKKHGMTGTKLYTSWQSMKQRSKSYNVPIEPEWIDSYDNWFCDIGSKCKEGYEFSLLEKEKGFVRNNIEIITTRESRYKNTAVSVIKCDKDGLALEEYSSAIDASKDTDKATPGHITACCRGKRNSHAGFKWKYKK